MNIINIAKAGAITSAPRLAEVGHRAVFFFLRVFGFVAILGIVVAGIIYILAGGNEETISLAKRALKYGIIGIVLVLATMIILQTIINILK